MKTLSDIKKFDKSLKKLTAEAKARQPHVNVQGVICSPLIDNTSVVGDLTPLSVFQLSLSILHKFALSLIYNFRVRVLDLVGLLYE
ncbi:hypothetical protein J6590_007896 [Homalodisca vitripennis]|nr:hypothetical protein J6590_007896 [Homalodisca vitripennis]